MAIKRSLATIIPIFGLVLVGCESTHEKFVETQKAVTVWMFKQPQRDNRFPNSSHSMDKFREVGDFVFDTDSSSRHIYLDPRHIIRCDNPVTICRYGITDASVSYTVKRLSSDSGKAFISGQFLFAVQKSVRSDSPIGDADKSVPDGFPLLPLESTSIPFSGVTGNGEVISVSGPYDTVFEISIKFSQ